MKKIIALFLVMVMLFALVACGNSEVTETVETTEPVENDADLWPLPELNYDGRDINIFTRHDYLNTHFDAQYTGDIVDNAIFQRNSTIEESINVNLNYYALNTTATIWGANDIFKTQVLAGVADGSMDIVIGHNHLTLSMAQEGYYANLTSDTEEVKYLDFSQEYWPESLQEELSYNNKLYVAGGDADLSILTGSICLFFNKDMMKEYGTTAEEMYNLVNSGKWTLEKLYEIASQVYSDNGDGLINDYDTLGFILRNENQALNFVTAAGIRYTSADAEGMRLFDLGNDKLLDLLDILNQYMSDVAFAPVEKSGLGPGYTKNFEEGRALFTSGEFSDAITYNRVEELTFGVLPFPKYDDSQQTYQGSSREFSLFAISTASHNKEAAGAVLQLLAYLGRKDISPIYFEKCLQLRYSNEVADAQMFDIIRNGIVFDFGAIIGPFSGDITPDLRREIAQSKGTWISTWNSKKTLVNNYCKTYFENLKNLDS